MFDEEWFADAVDDLCNPMTDSSPADIDEIGVGLSETDRTKDNEVHRNVVNVYCESSSRNENTSRSSTPVCMQQMVTGEMTMTNNNYASNNNV